MEDKYKNTSFEQKTPSIKKKASSKKTSTTKFDNDMK